MGGAKNASRWRQKSRFPLLCRVRARFLALLSSLHCYHHLSEYGVTQLNLSLKVSWLGLRSDVSPATHQLDHPAVKFVSQTLREADATALCYVCKNVGFFALFSVPVEKGPFSPQRVVLQSLDVIETLGLSTNGEIAFSVLSCPFSKRQTVLSGAYHTRIGCVNPSSL